MSTIKIKQDLITALPADPVERKRLAGIIKEAVEVKLSIKDLQESLKTIKEVEKEDHNYNPKFLNQLISLEYDFQYEQKKKKIALEEMQERSVELDILMKRSVEEIATEGCGMKSQLV
jgi:hypothetical protein